MDNEFKILERIIQAANLRQRVIASNIANTDTPGYKAKDIDFRSVVGEEQLRLSISDSEHISKTDADRVSGELIVENTLSWGDSNNVELDVEVAKMMENALIYEAGIGIMSTKIRMFRNAIKRR